MSEELTDRVERIGDAIENETREFAEDIVDQVAGEHRSERTQKFRTFVFGLAVGAALTASIFIVL